VLQLFGRRTVKLARWLVAAAIGVAAIACSGSKAGSASAPAAAPTGDPHAQIEQLDREIDGDMRRANLAQPSFPACRGAGCATAMTTPFATPDRADLQCHPAPSERCNQACTLSGSICRNQEKICDLARQLPGDDWAANKCGSARASCKSAHDSCCTCAA
jgi:hypothetical protein